ncbi:MAG TPA: hypothetical protein VFW70_09530, partial [Methylomirabilota bacterium]|nr:hypothetical protein [Methylomirabilota bacterium]
LPEHDGLAARYPNDQGLATDPTVVLADGFEGPISLWTRTIGKPEVTDRSERVHAGRRALELTIQGPAAIGLEKYVNAGLHRLFLRYYLKYDDTFPGAHHVGGMLSARAPRVPETAPEQFYPSGRTRRYGASSDRRSLLGRTSCPRVVSGTAMS